VQAHCNNWHDASYSPWKRSTNKNEYSVPPPGRAPVFCLMFHNRCTQSIWDITRGLRPLYGNTHATRETNYKNVRVNNQLVNFAASFKQEHVFVPTYTFLFRGLEKSWELLNKKKKNNNNNNNSNNNNNNSINLFMCLTTAKQDQNRLAP
jgi:hypothetical protein